MLISLSDWQCKQDPPFNINPLVQPSIQRAPSILNPGLNLERLSEFTNLIRRVKELEDKMGCLCPEEREKPDYIKILEDKVRELEAKINGEQFTT